MITDGVRWYSAPQETINAQLLPTAGRHAQCSLTMIQSSDISPMGLGYLELIQYGRRLWTLRDEAYIGLLLSNSCPLLHNAKAELKEFFHRN